MRELVISEGKWRSYLHFAFNDPEARVRAAALDVLPALLTSGHVAIANGKALGQDLRERVLARCQDVDALAGAAALRAACALAQVEALEEAWRRRCAWRFGPILEVFECFEAERVVFSCLFGLDSAVSVGMA